MDSDELETLIGRAQQGDQEAWNRIFSLYLERVHESFRGKIDARIRAKVDTWEIVQTGMQEAFSDLARYEYHGPGSFYRWLCRIVEHKLYGRGVYWRAKRRDVRREVPLPSATGGDSQAGRSLRHRGTEPPAKAARAEQAAIIREEIARLREPYRTVMSLHQDGLIDAEIGTRLGKSADAVRWLRVEAIRMLAPRLRARLGTRRSG